jgi:hypothetical protein
LTTGSHKILALKDSEIILSLADEEIIGYLILSVHSTVFIKRLVPKAPDKEQ